jgi:hypothetical protein
MLPIDAGDVLELGSRDRSPPFPARFLDPQTPAYALAQASRELRAIMQLLPRRAVEGSR